MRAARARAEAIVAEEEAGLEATLETNDSPHFNATVVASTKPPGRAAHDRRVAELAKAILKKAERGPRHPECTPSNSLGCDEGEDIAALDADEDESGSSARSKKKSDILPPLSE